MRKFILGTDWWTDCDDAVALRLLTRHVKAGSADLIGVCINAAMEYSVASLRGFLMADGIENIPIGLDREATDYGGNPPYQKNLAMKFGAGISNADAEDAKRLYRRLIAESDEPIEIIEIGFLQTIASVLESEGDDISPLSGIELFNKKVKKVWVMAGKWDKDGEKEHNFCFTERSRAGGKKFLELCPTEITFLGWEVGYTVISGGRLDKSDHLYTVLKDHRSENGRCSWDPMLTLMALIGDEEAAGYSTVRGKATLNEHDGSNYFKEDKTGPHKYVVKTKSDSYYEDLINSIVSRVTQVVKT